MEETSVQTSEVDTTVTTVSDDTSSEPINLLELPDDQLTDEQVLDLYEAQYAHLKLPRRGGGPRKRKRLKKVVGAEPGSYVYNTKKPTHPALDYSILRWTQYDRLITVNEAAAISTYTVRKIHWLSQMNYIPFIHDGYRRLFATETALFLKELKASGPEQQRLWKECTDRHDWRQRLESDPEVRQIVIDGPALTKIRQKQRVNERRKEKRAMERPAVHKIPVYKTDPWTKEKFVVRYREVPTT